MKPSWSNLVVTSKFQIFHCKSCDIGMVFDFVFHDRNFLFKKLLPKKEDKHSGLNKLYNKETYLWKRSRRGKSEKAIHFSHSLFLSLFHHLGCQSLLFPVALVFLILRWCFLGTSRSFLLTEWNEKEKKEHKSMRNRNRNEMESSIQTQRSSSITFSTCKLFRELEQGRCRWQRERRVNIAFPQTFLFVMPKKSTVKTYNFYTSFFLTVKKGSDGLFF